MKETELDEEHKINEHEMEKMHLYCKGVLLNDREITKQQTISKVLDIVDRRKMLKSEAIIKELEILEKEIKKLKEEKR